MDDITIARAIHVLAVTHWIGGVSFVTLVILPAIRKDVAPGERLARFKQVEHRFAGQARISVLLAGLAGFYMVERLDYCWAYLDVHYWWLHAMTGVWAIFAAVLFIIEPLASHRSGRKRTAPTAAPDTERKFRFMQNAHYVLLTLSLATIAAAVMGAHGMLN